MTRDFYYDALTAQVRLRDRLRAISANPVRVAGATVAILLVVVPVLVGIGLVLGGVTDGGGWAFLVMILLMGVAAVVSVLWDAGKGGALANFAAANELDLVTGAAATEYAGSLFQGGRQIVQASVRTPEQQFVEVGDRFHVAAPEVGYNVATDRVQAVAANEPELFLRGRLVGPVPESRTPYPTPELEARIRDFAGEHTVEIAGDELTVFGTRQLRPDQPGRVAEAFALLDELVAEANARVAEPTPYNVIAVEPPARAGRWMPLQVGGALLAMLVVLSFGFAFVMSIVDNYTHAKAVVLLVVAALLAVTGRLVLLIVRRAAGVAPAEGAKRRRLWPWLLVGAVGFVALGVVAVALDSPGSADPDTMSIEDCGGSWYCEMDVATRIWATEHGVARVDFDELRCEDLGSGRASCPLRVECDGGHADLVVTMGGTPRAVTGVRVATGRGRSSQGRSPATAEVDSLVAAACRPA